MDGAADTAADQPSGCRSGEGRLLPIATCATSGGGGGGRNPCHGARTDRASCARSRAPNDRLHVGFDDDGNEIDEGSRRRTAAGRRRWPGRLRGGYAAKALAYHPSSMQRTGVADPTEFERRRWAAEDLTNWATSSSGWPGPEPRQSTRNAGTTARLAYARGPAAPASPTWPFCATSTRCSARSSPPPPPGRPPGCRPPVPAVAYLQRVRAVVTCAVHWTWAGPCPNSPAVVFRDSSAPTLRGRWCGMC